MFHTRNKNKNRTGSTKNIIKKYDWARRPELGLCEEKVEVSPWLTTFWARSDREVQEKMGI